MFIAFIAAAASTLPNATAVDPGSWFSPDNYPAEAAKRGIQGSVTFDVDVDADGKPSACRITTSSGSAILDQATCDVVLSKGRFIAATDAQGHPVAGHYSNRANWELQGPPPPQPPARGELITGSRLPVPAADAPLATAVPDELLSDATVSEPERESYEAAEKFGACLVSAEPHASMDFAVSTPGSDLSEAALKKLKTQMPFCLGPWTSQMEIQPALARGVIAEALYRLQFARRPQPTGPVSVAPVLSASQRDPRDLHAGIVYDFAQCITDANPSAVRALALSKIGSQDEKAAFAAIVPAMAPCLYKGQTVQIDRLSLRFRLDEALYRWSVAAAREEPASTFQSQRARRSRSKETRRRRRI